MDLRIGITQTNQVIEVELDDASDRDALKKQIDGALSGTDPVLWVTDRKGRETGIPTSQISWVEVGTVDPDRRIGFGA